MTITALSVPAAPAAGSSFSLSARAADRMRTDVATLFTERENLARSVVETTGDAADHAWLAERDSQLEQLDRRITRLRLALDSTPVATGPLTRDRVSVGVAVSLRFAGEKATERYFVGVMEEQDERTTVLTPSSPLGRALLGAAVGDTVTYSSPRGAEQVSVVAIG